MTELGIETERGADRARREPVTRARVVQAALRIMDQEGLEAVTMRRVGRELGVEAMSLYNHVRDKEDILDGICEAALAEFRTPDVQDWAEAARVTAHEYRRILLAHPEVITLMAERKRPFTTPDSLRIYEYALGLFRDAGLSERDAVKAFHTFGGYVLGCAVMERGLMVGGPGCEEQTGHHLEMVQMIQALDLPRLQAALPYLHDCDVVEQFDFGLTLLIEGLRARAAARSV
jgi:AcrR family transcriptional regulator